MNTHGNIFKITTFGESHGPGLGVVIDGFPSNFKIDFDYISKEMIRRNPGQNSLVTQRKENDKDFEVISGVFEGCSTGHPITFIVKNKGTDSSKYENIKNIYRPNHADLTYDLKYGIRDYRGGGRSSGRETVSRVLAGALAKQYLKEKYGIEFFAFTKQIGKYIGNGVDYNFIEKNPLKVADKSIEKEVISLVENIKNNGDSIGGIIECHIKKVPSGLGEPIFGKIKSILAGSMLSLGSVVGFEYGAGFNTINLTGETNNEGFIKEGGKIFSENNKYGGILGGITTGEDIIFRVAIKPTPSIYKPQKTLNSKGNKVDLKIEGKHDPCILPRVIPVIESMCAIDILDLIMLDKAKK